MATTYATYTGDGSNNKAFSFPSYKEADIKVEVDGTIKTTSTHYTISNYTTTGGGTIVFTSGNIPSSGTIRIFRDTEVDAAKATYTAGASIKAGDLNNNQTQVLYALQEEQNQLIQPRSLDTSAVTTVKIAADSITGAKIADDQINSEHIAAGAVDLEHMSANSVDSDQYVDGSIDLIHMSANSVDSDQYVDGSVDLIHLSSNSVDSSKIVDGSIVNADISSSAAIDASKIVSSTSSVAGTMSSADKAKLDAIEASATADQTNAEIRAAVEAATDSNVFTDADHSKLNAIEASATADQSNAEIRAAVEAATDSNVFTDTDHSKLNAIEASATADQTASEIKSLIASSPLDASHLAADSVTTSEIADAELTTLAGMQTGTASILAGGTALTSTLSELNLLDGKSVVTAVSGSSTDVQLPTAKAVNDQIVNLLNEAGGFVPIANEVSFPNANPDPNDGTGTIVSIADAGGVVVNGSGVSTTGRTLGGATVTINGIDSSLNSSTIAAGKGMLVQTTSTLNTYTYHRLVVDEAGVANAQSLVSDFNERYRTGSSNPTSSLDDGDLFFNTSSDKMLVYNATSSAWEEVQSVGNYFINTISSYSGTGGNNATFNGSAYRFVLSNPGTYAEQHIVSVNGVIQKPNSGTSQPSEGFAIDGSSIIFSAAPATGSDFFIITIGASVNIGTPSDNTVDTDIIQNGAVTTAKIADDAVTADKLANSINTEIAANTAKTTNATHTGEVTGSGALTIANDAVTGAKIADDAVGAEHIEVLDADLKLADGVKTIFGDGNDIQIWHDAGAGDNIRGTGTKLEIRSPDLKLQNSASETYIRCISDGAVELYHNNFKSFETWSNGIYVYGPEGGGGIIRLYGDEGDDNADKWDFNANTNGTLLVRNYASGSWENSIIATGNGNVELYYDNSKKLETTAYGAKISSNGSAGYLEVSTTGNLGEGHIEIIGGEDGKASLSLTADEGDDNADRWRVSGAADGTFTINNKASGSWETNFKTTGNGAVELYYDNTLRAQTTANGFQAFGNLTIRDNVIFYIGDANDLQIYHDGSHSRIDEVGTGDLKLQTNNAVWIQKAAAESIAAFIADGACELYYDNSRKLETFSSGVQFDDNIVIKDNKKANFGDGYDLQIYHDSGGDSYIQEKGPGVLYITATQTILQNNDTSENLAKFLENGSCELYYDNSKKLETKSYGVNMPDSSFLYFGNGDDLGIHHDGTDSQIANSTGKLRFKSDEHFWFTKNNGSNALYIDPDGVTILYNNSSAKLETSGSGITVYGTVSETSDVALKKDITPLSDSLAKVKQLKGYSYKFKETDIEAIGFTAQEVEKIYPNLVEGEEGKKGLNYSGLIAPLLEAVKELSTKIETLETKVAALEAK